MKKRILITCSFVLGITLYLFQLNADVSCYTLPSYVAYEWQVMDPDIPCSQWRIVMNYGCIGDGHSGASACEDRKQDIFQVRTGYDKPGGGCEDWSYESPVKCAADAKPCGS